jgi:hypothetical protein
MYVRRVRGGRLCRAVDGRGGEWGSALEVPYAAEMRGMTGADRLMGASLFRPLSSLYLSSLRHGLSFR